jgi:hypothetical protein
VFTPHSSLQSSSLTTPHNSHSTTLSPFLPPLLETHIQPHSPHTSLHPSYFPSPPPPPQTCGNVTPARYLTRTSSGSSYGRILHIRANPALTISHKGNSSLIHPISGQSQPYLTNNRVNEQLSLLHQGKASLIPPQQGKRSIVPSTSG